MTSAPSPTDMDGLQLVLEHASLAPPSRRRQQPSLIATFPPELILQIRKHVLELKLWTDEWENAEEAHRTSESLRKVCVAWYVALADDVTEMTAWSSRGCEKLARYLEKDGKGARVQRLVVGPTRPDMKGGDDRSPAPAAVLRLLEATPNLGHLFITLDSGNFDFLRLVPRLLHLSLRAAAALSKIPLLLPGFASYPNVPHLQLTGS